MTCLKVPGLGLVCLALLCPLRYTAQVLSQGAVIGGGTRWQ